MQVINGGKVTHQMTWRRGDRPDDLVWSRVITVFIRGRARTRGREYEEDLPSTAGFGDGGGGRGEGGPGSRRGPGADSPRELPEQGAALPHRGVSPSSL